MQETQEIRVQSLYLEDPLEEGMATHSSILAWRISWTAEPSRLLVHGVARDTTEHACTHTHTHTHIHTEVCLSFFNNTTAQRATWGHCGSAEWAFVSNTWEGHAESSRGRGGGVKRDSVLTWSVSQGGHLMNQLLLAFRELILIFSH